MIRLNREQAYLLKLMLEYKKNLVYIGIFLVISTCINLILPIINKNIMDFGFIGKDFNILIAMILIVFFLKVIDQVIEWIKEKLRVDMQLDLKKNLSKKAFISLLEIDVCYFYTSNEAQVINNLETDISNMSNIFDGSTIFVITQVFNILGGLIGLFFISPILTLIVMLFVPFKYFVVKYFTIKREREVAEYIKNVENYTKWFSGIIRGIKEIRIFNLKQQKNIEFNKKQNSIIKNNRYMEFIFIKNNIFDVLITECLSTILYIIGAMKVFDLSITVGGVFAFISYSIYVTTPISAILNIKLFLSGILPSTKRFLEFLNLECEVDNGEEIAKNGDIILEKISFSYKNSNFDHNIFDELDLKIKNMEKIAIIGKNGSGKSTLLNLILRFYTPCDGKITINNRDINNYSISSYRNLFSMVSQEIYLFNDTIKNNITLYKEVPEEYIWDVLKKVSLYDFVKMKTLDYFVGENGSMLSGGQKQKIALARALIKNSPIIILDEVTSSIDDNSKKVFRSVINSELKYKTVIMITHNIEEINEGTHIYEIKNKKLDRIK